MCNGDHDGDPCARHGPDPQGNCLQGLLPWAALLAARSCLVLMSETYNWQFAIQERGIAAAFAMVILGLSAVYPVPILRVLHVPKWARL